MVEVYLATLLDVNALYFDDDFNDVVKDYIKRDVKCLYDVYKLIANLKNVINDDASYIEEDSDTSTLFEGLEQLSSLFIKDINDRYQLVNVEDYSNKYSDIDVDISDSNLMCLAFYNGDWLYNCSIDEIKEGIEGADGDIYAVDNDLQSYGGIDYYNNSISLGHPTDLVEEQIGLEKLMCMSNNYSIGDDTKVLKYKNDYICIVESVREYEVLCSIEGQKFLESTNNLKVGDVVNFLCQYLNGEDFI